MRRRDENTKAVFCFRPTTRTTSSLAHQRSSAYPAEGDTTCQKRRCKSASVAESNATGAGAAAGSLAGRAGGYTFGRVVDPSPPFPSHTSTTSPSPPSSTKTNAHHGRPRRPQRCPRVDVGGGYGLQRVQTKTFTRQRVQQKHVCQEAEGRRRRAQVQRLRRTTSARRASKRRCQGSFGGGGGGSGGYVGGRQGQQPRVRGMQADPSSSCLLARAVEQQGTRRAEVRAVSRSRQRRREKGNRGEASGDSSRGAVRGKTRGGVRWCGE